MRSTPLLTSLLTSVCALALVASAGDAHAVAQSPRPAAPTADTTHTGHRAAGDSLRADSLRADSLNATGRTPDAPHAWPAFTLGAWFGAAERSPTNAFGRVPERALRLLAFRVGWTIAHTRHLALDYQVDVVPLARISGPPLTAVLPECPPATRCVTDWAIADDRAVYGAGGAPIGLQLRARPGRRVQPFLAASGGALVFSRPVPVDDAQRFNFTAELGGGTILGRPGRLGMLLGYKFHHLSNGGMANVNPGLDGHVFYAGVLKVPR